MRIHSDSLTSIDIINALQEQKGMGRVAFTVNFATLSRHGSRKRAEAFELKLSSYQKAKGDGRRWGNSGAYGATSQTTGEYTATYDEWGWLLAALYKLDSEMLTPYYADLFDFEEQTGMSYFPEQLIQTIEDMGTDPYPYVRRTPQAGRIGYGRVTGDSIPLAHLQKMWLKMPRTVTQVQKFAKLDPTLVAAYGDGRAHVKDAAGNLHYTTSFDN